MATSQHYASINKSINEASSEVKATERLSINTGCNIEDVDSTSIPSTSTTSTTSTISAENNEMFNAQKDKEIKHMNFRKGKVVDSPVKTYKLWKLIKGESLTETMDTENRSRSTDLYKDNFINERHFEYIVFELTPIIRSCFENKSMEIYFSLIRPDEKNIQCLDNALLIMQQEFQDSYQKCTDISENKVSKIRSNIQVAHSEHSMTQTEEIHYIVDVWFYEVFSLLSSESFWHKCLNKEKIIDFISDLKRDCYRHASKVKFRISEDSKYGGNAELYRAKVKSKVELLGKEDKELIYKYCSFQVYCI